MATQAEIQAKINEIITGANYPAPKMRPLLTSILDYIVATTTVTTRAQLLSDISNAEIIFGRNYYITDAISSSAIIQVFGTEITTVSENAQNITNGTFGTYDITTDIFVAQGGGGGGYWETGSAGINSVKVINSTVLDATGNYALAEGQATLASGQASHAEGQNTIASGPVSHAEGGATTASGNSSHAEGNQTTASGNTSHAEGFGTLASEFFSHAEGSGTTASGNTSHAEGQNTTASGTASHAEGSGTTASGNTSHAEGFGTLASEFFSHAEGQATLASGQASHAEGQNTTASGNSSHAEGNQTIANGKFSHAGGRFASTTIAGEWARSTGSGTNTKTNRNQYGIIDYFRQTTDAILTEVFIGGDNTAQERLLLAVGDVLRIRLTAICVNAGTGGSKEFTAEGIIKNIGGTTSSVGIFSTVSTFADASMASASMSITANNGNDSLLLQVTGIAAATINWFVKVEYVKVSIGI